MGIPATRCAPERLGTTNFGMHVLDGLWALELVVGAARSYFYESRAVTWLCRHKC